MANTMLDNLGGQMTILKSALQELGIAMGDTLVPMVKKVVAVVQNIVDWFNNLSDTQKALVTKVLLFVAALAPMLTVFEAISSGSHNLLLSFARLYANISTGQGVIGVLVKTVLPALKTGLVAIFNVLRANPIGMVITIIGLLIAAFVALWNKSEAFRNFWIGLWQKLKSAVATAVNGIKTAWNAVYNNLISPVKKAWTTIKNVFSGVKSHFSGIGKNIVSGIWAGLSGQLGWIKSLIKGWVGNVKDFIKRLFGIHSPSRWMKEQIGTNLAKGLGIGFEDELGTVNKSIANSLDKTMTVMTSASLDSPTTSGVQFDYNSIATGLIDALSGIEMRSVVQLDGKTVAEPTAPFMEKALSSRAARASRKLGYT
ncbi:MAG: phage tail tape measure protein [Clostridiaceae bacterium]|nr:phage tail tape measure protein [Clostridiaceae bacterium]